MKSKIQKFLEIPKDSEIAKIAEIPEIWNFAECEICAFRIGGCDEILNGIRKIRKFYKNSENANFLDNPESRNSPNPNSPKSRIPKIHEIRNPGILKNIQKFPNCRNCRKSGNLGFRGISNRRISTWRL